MCYMCYISVMTMHAESVFGIAPNWSQIRKKTMASQFSDMTPLSIYWSTFHVNIWSYKVMTISFYKVLTRNPEIRNTPVWVLPNIWRLGLVRNKKFRMKVSYKILLNAAKCQGYSFYRFWVINSLNSTMYWKMLETWFLRMSSSFGSKMFQRWPHVYSICRSRYNFW